MKDVPSVEKDDMRQQVSNIIKNCPKTQNLTPDELKTLKLLKNDETIIIAPADKGRVTVVLDKKGSS